MEGGGGGESRIAESLATALVATFRFRVVVRVTEKLQMNGPVRQKGSGNKEKRKAEKQRRRWIGTRNQESSS